MKIVIRKNIFERFEKILILFFRRTFYILSACIKLAQMIEMFRDGRGKVIGGLEIIYTVQYLGDLFDGIILPPVVRYNTLYRRGRFDVVNGKPAACRYRIGL